jgi:hypothetical protein
VRGAAGMDWPNKNRSLWMGKKSSVHRMCSMAVAIYWTELEYVAYKIDDCNGTIRKDDAMTMQSWKVVSVRGQWMGRHLSSIAVVLCHQIRWSSLDRHVSGQLLRRRGAMIAQ